MIQDIVIFCIYLAAPALFAFIGVQIYLRDFELLAGIYNYRIRIPQLVTYVAAILGVATIYFDICCCEKGPWGFLICSVFSYFYSWILEWIFAKINSSRRILNYLLRICGIYGLAALQLTCLRYNFEFIFVSATPFLIMGIYMRNCKFGVVNGKEFFVANYLMNRSYEKIDKSFEEELTESDIAQLGLLSNDIPNFKHAGICRDINEIFAKLPHFCSSDLGIEANSGKDCTAQLQAALDKIGSEGGGTLTLAKGKYRVRHLQMNYCNVALEGALNHRGRPQAEIILTCNLAQGKRNPWLSPFMITTGEKLQQSNIFFGLQFKNRKETFTQSSSLSDPGSDGNILTPDFATRVTATAQKGDTFLKVEDSTKVGKFIMLGLYNSTDEGDLLKDILGIDEFRPEWKTALRAGPERAPSYQWLVEVKRIVDEHSIELVQPLWRNCDLRFEPSIYNVPMLENICIRNLKLNSCWNGLFRHHGYRRYYTVAQTQEMDYGWNGINMKRVSNGLIENVTFRNFTNPLYVMDSRNVTSQHITFCGYDGHQGIKIYEHACDNLFQNVIFKNHFADMMGGEGNAYGNVFRKVQYVNPVFKPVDFDFHGFSEGPMSPPSHNLFELVDGFALIHSGGSNHMHPSCAQHNIWWNCQGEGELKNSFIFRNRYNKKAFVPQEQCRIYRNSGFFGMHGSYNEDLLNRDFITVRKWNEPIQPSSLFLFQRKGVN